jgi:hypothetical protein
MDWIAAVADEGFVASRARDHILRNLLYANELFPAKPASPIGIDCRSHIEAAIFTIEHHSFNTSVAKAIALDDAMSLKLAPLRDRIVHDEGGNSTDRHIPVRQPIAQCAREVNKTKCREE